MRTPRARRRSPGRTKAVCAARVPTYAQRYAGCSLERLAERLLTELQLRFADEPPPSLYDMNALAEVAAGDAPDALPPGLVDERSLLFGHGGQTCCLCTQSFQGKF